MALRESLDRSVSSYTSTDFVRVSMGDAVATAAKRMREARATEAVVVGDKGLIGIVTERDILYKVVAEGLDPQSTKVSVIMSAPVETIEHNAKVGEAIAKMSKFGIRRLAVTKGGKFVGIVTQKNLASGRPGHDVPLPELAEPAGATCPYCGAPAKDNKDLSEHIDRAHLGLGLLEGNLSKW